MIYREGERDKRERERERSSWEINIYMGSNREKLIYLVCELFLLDLYEQQGELIICDRYRYRYLSSIATAIVVALLCS